MKKFLHESNQGMNRMLFSFVTLVLTLALAGSGLAADAPSRKKVQAPAAAAPVAPPPPPSCQPAEFREICLTVHDPLERKRRAKDWLAGHGAGCSIEKLLTLKANRQIWLGTADTPDLAATIDTLIDARESANASSQPPGVPPAAAAERSPVRR